MNLVEIEENIRRELLMKLDSTGETEDESILEMTDILVLENGRKYGLTINEKENIKKSVFASIRKLDIIQELIDDPSVTEIMINGAEKIFYERNGKIYRFEKHFSDEKRLMDIIQKIAGRCNRIVNEQSPIVDAHLENGDRVNIVLPPVSLCGPVMTIRRFPEDPVRMTDLINWECLTKEAAEFLEHLVGAGYTILVSGGTSTGKTTFLNALSEYIPKGERVITIEDNAELKIRGVDNLVSLETKNANLEESKEISVRDLIKTALRMRPNRIIIGEVRGSEAADFLTCLNTGHSGSLGTAHANSAKDMIGRMESMVRMGQDLQPEVIREQIASGIEIIVQLTRDAFGKRKLEEISEINMFVKGEIELNQIFVRNEYGELIRKGELFKKRKMEMYEEFINSEKRYLQGFPEK